MTLVLVTARAELEPGAPTRLRPLETVQSTWAQLMPSSDTTARSAIDRPV